MGASVRPNGMSSAAAALRYWERRQEVASNNLANVSTDGFKGQKVFARMIEGALPAADAVTDFTQGSLENTNNPRDIALDGKGFFVVKTANGERYSRGSEYRATKEKLAEAVLDTASMVIPDLREHIVHREASTPITQERFTLSTGGACYGLEMTLDQLGPFRPDVATAIPGLFLAGASTKHQHGIVATLNGGAGTAGAILGRDLIAEMRAGAVYADGSRLAVDAADWDPLVVAKPGSPIRRAPRRSSGVAQRS